MPAYAKTVTLTRVGRRGWRVRVVETDVAASSEAELVTETGGRPPTSGRLLWTTSTLTGGDGATVAPLLGTATAPTGNSVISQASAAAAVNVTGSGKPYYTSGGALFHRSTPNAGTNNAVTTDYYILEGWE